MANVSSRALLKGQTHLQFALLQRNIGKHMLMCSQVERFNRENGHEGAIRIS